MKAPVKILRMKKKKYGKMEDVKNRKIVWVINSEVIHQIHTAQNLK